MEDYDQFLRTKVEDFYGAAIINATDCEKLANEIRRTIDVQLGYQTLRRFWRLVKSQTETSNTTKSILANYLGYKDFAHFCQHAPNDVEDRNEVNFDIIEKLFGKKSEHLVGNNNDITNYNDWNEAMVQVLVMYIFSNKSTFELFVEKLHKNKMAVQYVIANYQCYHLLYEEWYLRGLQLCCNYSNVVHHKVYGHSMLGLAALFSKDYVKLEAVLQDIAGYRKSMREQYGIVFPLEGAIYGLRLVHAKHIGADAQVEALLQEVKDLCKQHEKATFEKVLTHKSLVRTLLEVLCWGGLYLEAGILLKQYGPDEVFTERHINRSLVITNQLHLAMIYSHNGEEAKAKDLFDQITNLDLVRFDRQSISNVMYQLLRLKFTSATAVKKRSGYLEELYKLIQTYRYDIFLDQIPVKLPC